VVERRIAYLNNLLDSKSYCRKKLALKADFEAIMRKNLFEAKPDDLRLFLIKKDEVGKTRVHDMACPFLGTENSTSCFCPKRLAAGTILAYIAQFRAMFNDIGRVEPWESSMHFERCNPANSVLLRRYADAIKLEQAISHVSAKQAKPIFLEKLEKLSFHLSDQLSEKSISVSNRFVYL
jgi:hypothetical protein